MYKGISIMERIFKFYGKAYSESNTVSVTASLDGVEMYSGLVPTTASSAPVRVTDIGEVLFNYTGTTDLTGDLPFELSTTNGTVFFGFIEANYSGSDSKLDQTDPDNPVAIVIVAPEDFWADVNSNSIETDGKTNVAINGVRKYRNVINPDEIGDWWYEIPESGTLTCNIFIDPEIVVTESPTVDQLLGRASP